jgi:hypothetical protein
MVPSGVLTGCHTQPLRSALRRIEVGCTPLSGWTTVPNGSVGRNGTIGPHCHSSVIVLSQLVSLDLATLHS